MPCSVLCDQCARRRGPTRKVLSSVPGVPLRRCAHMRWVAFCGFPLLSSTLFNVEIVVVEQNHCICNTVYHSASPEPSDSMRADKLRTRSRTPGSCVAAGSSSKPIAAACAPSGQLCKSSRHSLKAPTPRGAPAPCLPSAVGGPVPVRALPSLPWRRALRPIFRLPLRPRLPSRLGCSCAAAPRLAPPPDRRRHSAARTRPHRRLAR